MTRSSWTLFCVVVVSAVSLNTVGGGAQQPAGADAEFVPNEVLIQYGAGVSAQSKATARARVGGAAVEVLARESARGDGRGDLELVRIPPGLAVADAVRGLQGDSAVTFAEPNWIYTHGLVSNDP